MQLGGQPIRVTLTADLTRYDQRLVTGTTGWTQPGRKCGMWGSQDRFVAVAFDCGAERDILWSSLDAEKGN